MGCNLSSLVPSSSIVVLMVAVVQAVANRTSIMISIVGVVAVVQVVTVIMAVVVMMLAVIVASVIWPLQGLGRLFSWWMYWHPNGSKVSLIMVNYHFIELATHPAWLVPRPRKLATCRAFIPKCFIVALLVDLSYPCARAHETVAQLVQLCGPRCTSARTHFQPARPGFKYWIWTRFWREVEMAHSLADWDLNVASPIIELRVRPPRTESILDDPGLQPERR